MQPIIVVHGGAGRWTEDESFLERAIQACVRAAQAGRMILMSDGTALDAVESAVQVLEDAPELDAGRGSYLNSAGEIELDALIMDGATLNLGAVAAVKNIRNPVSLARRVMDSTPHNVLVAAGAEAFADAIQFPRCTPDELLVDPSRQRRASRRSKLDLSPSGPPENTLGDTVGAVALDRAGNVAAATSTGGTRGKWPGRVGDSPLVGSGAYADNESAAVSATGQGEALMKIVISRRICQAVETGQSAQLACQTAIDMLASRVQGQGGVICVVPGGEIGIAYNTRAMPHAYALGSSTITSGR